MLNRKTTERRIQMEMMKMEMIARYKTRISRAPFVNGSDKVFTEVKVNICCHRSETLFVVAIHNPIVKEIPAIENKYGNIIEVAPSRKREEGDKDAIIYEIDGIFRVTRRERTGKIPVLHLNPTTEEPTGMWIDLVSGGLHDNSGYSVEKGDTSYVWESSCHSGGGATVNNKLIGFVYYNTILRYFEDSYKGRSGSSVYFYEVTRDGLKRIGTELTDGLDLDDLFLENN